MSWHPLRIAGGTTIHVKLLDEAVDVWRPVPAADEGHGIYRLDEEHPEGERWEFPPGSRVRCEPRTLVKGVSESMSMVAFELADTPAWQPPDSSLGDRGGAMHYAKATRFAKKQVQPIEFPVAGDQLYQCSIGVSELRFSLWKGWSVVLFGAFRMETADGRVQDFDAEDEPPSSLGPALDTAIGVEAKSLAADPSGDLRFDLENGTSFLGWPHPQFEGWWVNGPSDLEVICLPEGGGVDVFLPSSESRPA